MTQTQLRSTTRGLLTGAGIAATAYAGYVGTTWLRYGHVTPARDDERDPLLDRFMPAYEIAERHHIKVCAPARTAFDAACEVDLQRSAIVRTIFKGREQILGADPDDRERPRGLVPLTKALGWGVLAQVPGREIVMGCVTRPWKASPTFRALPAEEFAAFDRPRYIKIVWTLRVDPISDEECIVRTETRAVATDPLARAKFRWYWSVFSPGIVLIRRVTLGFVKADAERRARQLPVRDRFELVSVGDLDPQC